MKWSKLKRGTLVRYNKYYVKWNISLEIMVKYFKQIKPICNIQSLYYEFLKDYNLPRMMIFHVLLEQGGCYTKFSSSLRKYYLTKKVTEPNRPNKNIVEVFLEVLCNKSYSKIF